MPIGRIDIGENDEAARFMLALAVRSSAASATLPSNLPPTIVGASF
jgi:hypothetical protein